MQLEELLLQVVPGCTLAEQSALEAILTALAGQGRVVPAPLLALLLRDVCTYYVQLQGVTAAAAAAQGEHKDAGVAMTAPNGGKATRMDVDSGSEAVEQQSSASAAPPAPVSDEEATLRTALRHAFSLLALLVTASPAALEPRLVPVMLEIALSDDLAVSAAAGM